MVTSVHFKTSVTFLFESNPDQKANNVLTKTVAKRFFCPLLITIHDGKRTWVVFKIFSHGSFNSFYIVSFVTTHKPLNISLKRFACLLLLKMITDLSFYGKAKRSIGKGSGLVKVDLISVSIYKYQSSR